jgi:transcriptional regulator with XRE-family HTH domain
MALFRRLKTPFAEDLPDGKAAPPSGPRSAGDLLRQQREALRLDLDDVAAALRIKPDYLASLEAGRPDLLPGPTYAIGFMRTYSDYLSLDGGEILRRFKAESTGLDAKPDLAFPMPLGERSIPGGGDASRGADFGALRVRHLVLPVDCRALTSGTRRRGPDRASAVDLSAAGK